MLQPHRPRASSPALFVIRLALVMPVLIFGGLAWRRHSTRTEPLPAVDQSVTWLVLGVWTILTAGLVWLSRRNRRAADRGERVSNAIIGWAMGEMAAMFGAVYYFITGQPQRYGMGLLIFAIALMMFPIPRDDEGPRLMR